MLILKYRNTVPKLKKKLSYKSRMWLPTTLLTTLSFDMFENISFTERDIQIHDFKLSGPMSKIWKNKAIFSSKNSKQKKSKI